jgi:hypothetical protein
MEGTTYIRMDSPLSCVLNHWDHFDFDYLKKKYPDIYCNVVRTHTNHAVKKNGLRIKA